ncbi:MULTISPECIES: DUF6266 family protein [unclassified Sphingobacterium]|uniref:DUF6266 family protein n=1 Tax=unclassified Sphingobacterium TaxID=2609468 RepID=UPI0025F3B90E|nr:MULTISPECIES: DUF6266 family protein [unclassified Sphingobacterium]
MVKKAPTPAQLRVRETFKIACAFLAPLNGLIKKGFAEQAKRKRSLPFGQALSHTLRIAIRHEAEGPVVDPALVLLSDGSIAPANKPILTREKDRIIVTYTVPSDNLYPLDDQIILCAYQVEKGYAFINEKVWRRYDGQVILLLPAGFEADSFHVYLLFCDRKGKKYSRSRYLGYSTK